MSILTPVTVKRTIYRDFASLFRRNPITDDVTVKTNEEAIKESIKNLVLTDRGERLFRPNLGCDVRRSLFENITQSTLRDLEVSIENTIKTYEPRAYLISVEATSLVDDHTVNITIIFSTINRQEPIVLNLLLTRIR